MPKEGSTLPVSSNNRTRVSPYPLRSTRTKKQIVAPESPIQTIDAKEMEDIRCVICQEPPHNAVLLHCSHSSSGCRAYMCDTSVRHSNCFKQYRKANKNPITKVLDCPLCRGIVFETVKVKTARRFMNAQKRPCSVDTCEYSGTYSQLKTHMKAEHRGFVQKVDPLSRRRWEQMMRNAEYNEVMNAAGYQQETPFMVPEGLEGIVQHFLGPNRVMHGANSGAPLMPRLDVQILAMFQANGWIFS